MLWPWRELKHPHVALLDVGLPGQLELGIRLRAEAAELRLVVLTDVDDGPLALAAVRAGATAWVQKQAASSELVAALRGVVQGEARIPPRLLGLILLDLVATGSKAPAGPLDALSPREREVLQCMVDGLDRRQIADELLLSPNTVRTHMQNLLAKLNAHSGLEAVATGMRDGMRPRQATGGQAQQPPGSRRRRSRSRPAERSAGGSAFLTSTSTPLSHRPGSPRVEDTAADSEGAMEIDEAFERIFRRHWLLLVACVVMPMLIVLAVSAGSPTKWVAQTRVLVSSTTPTSAQGADALTSHARAIATSPSIVGAAFKQAGITRDANHFAQHNVSVSELGTSPIVVLTVTGRTAGEAQAIATALGDQVVAFLNDVGQGGIASALTQMQARITTATNQLTTLDQQVAANPTSVSLISQATSLRGLLDSLVADYDRLLTDQATQSPARVVSAAALPGRAQSSGLAQRVALAGLLGRSGRPARGCPAGDHSPHRDRVQATGSDARRTADRQAHAGTRRSR